VLINQQSKVYLTKRPKTMRFLGGYYVFPGGAVEREDAKIESEFIRNGEFGVTPSLVHYVAAVRELFEEVGIFLGRQANSSACQIQFTHKTDLEYRRLLINREITFAQILKQENLYLDFQHLTYFGHRITPKTSPIRFDTRFFLAHLPVGQHPSPDLHEIDKAEWMDPEEALTAYSNGEIDLARPTIDSLRTILKHKIGGELMMPAQQR
jgi:8-oxo-dGTP pyrophosphatase MutT (NUDIX family)